MRLDMNLPVVAVTLFAAALLQDMIPATPVLPVKIGFLTAVALYHMLTKPALVALTALVWAGGVTDALGGLPVFCTTGFLLVAYGAVRLLKRMFLEATLLQGTLLVACAAVVQTLWTRAWLGLPEPASVWRALVAAGYAVPAGLVAGCSSFAVCGLIDRLSGNKRPVKEENGILWAETDR